MLNKLSAVLCLSPSSRQRKALARHKKLQQIQADNQLLKKLLAVFVREITHVAALQEKGE